MNRRRILVVVSLILCTFLSLNPGIQNLARFPEHVISGTEIPGFNGILAHLIKRERIPEANPALSLNLATAIAQTEKISYKLFGIFPLKTSEIEKMPDLKLWPGGQSIGVTLQARGVMVVGQAPVIDQEGKKNYPAKEAGIEVGDIILKIDGQEVHTDQDVANAIHNAGERQGFASILLSHQGQIFDRTVKTIFCSETSRYRVGLFVRDEAAGVGTLTFIDPVTKKYGALGHVINDADTNQRIEVAGGQVVASTIYSIEKGSRGHPGEKIGSFVTDSTFSGTIERNSTAGIFGTLKGAIANPFFNEPLPVGWESDIKEGPAKIYTVINGTKIEEFDIKIERIMSNRTDSKNMIITVTDPRLIEQTGGIIQGMSGSPIIQDGKIIGAVTHVFVNDAKRGYGVFIQNMLKESGMLEKKEAA